VPSKKDDKQEDAAGRCVLMRAMNAAQSCSNRIEQHENQDRKGKRRQGEDSKNKTKKQTQGRKFVHTSNPAVSRESSNAGKMQMRSSARVAQSDKLV
jgi:hypothetical protein